MAAGEIALRGNPNTVRDRAADITGRTGAEGAAAVLRFAAFALSLKSQDGISVSLKRMRSIIEQTVPYASLVAAEDQGLGRRLGLYSDEIDGIQRRARLSGANQAASARAAAKYTALALEASAASSLANGGQFHLAAVQSAEEQEQSALQQLRALDEERQALDAATARAAHAIARSFSASRSLLPPKPHVSANVSVTVRGPDGRAHAVTAVGLAQLKDSKAIQQLWEQLTFEQRTALLEDHPRLLGNLDGIALGDRDTANRITAAAYRAELLALKSLLVHGGGTAVATQLERVEGSIRSIDAMLGDRNELYSGEDEAFGRYLIHGAGGTDYWQDGIKLVGFDALRGTIITYEGPLDPITGNVPPSMANIGISVPGTGAGLATYDELLKRSRNLVRASDGAAAMFTVIPGTMPDVSLLNGPHLRGAAETNGLRLASFRNSLDLAKSTSVAALGHSYGTAILGTAELNGLKADRVLYVAPAGLGARVTGLEAFPHTSTVPHFSIQARNDLVVGLIQDKSAFGTGHGAMDPVNGSGITRLETGHFLDERSGSAAVETTIRKGWAEPHSAIFTPSSTAFNSTVAFIVGADAPVFDAWAHLPVWDPATEAWAHKDQLGNYRMVSTATGEQQ